MGNFPFQDTRHYLCIILVGHFITDDFDGFVDELRVAFKDLGHPLQHYGYCPSQVCGICFFRGSFFSEEISGSFLLLFPLSTTTAGRIGETCSHTLV